MLVPNSTRTVLKDCAPRTYLPGKRYCVNCAITEVTNSAVRYGAHCPAGLHETAAGFLKAGLRSAQQLPNESIRSPHLNRTFHDSGSCPYPSDATKGIALSTSAFCFSMCEVLDSTSGNLASNRRQGLSGHEHGHRSVGQSRGCGSG